MKQHIKHGYSCNIQTDLNRMLDYVHLINGIYNHTEIITYGADHSKATLIVHFIDTKADDQNKTE